MLVNAALSPTYQDVVPAMRPVTDATGSHRCSVTKMLPVLHFH
jgi:hypothetical protein